MSAANMITLPSTLVVDSIGRGGGKTFFNYILFSRLLKLLT